MRHRRLRKSSPHLTSCLSYLNLEAHDLTACLSDVPTAQRKLIIQAKTAPISTTDRNGAVSLPHLQENIDMACLRQLLSISTFAVLIAGPALAQTAATGTIAGTVTDSTGAIVPGAAVVLPDTATGAVRTLPPNNDGQ